MKTKKSFRLQANGATAVSCAALLLLTSASTQAQTTYIYAPANVTGTPATPVNWSTASLWGGTAPVSANNNTIVFFDATGTTVLGNTALPSLQTVNNDIANPFELGTLTLGGRGSAAVNTNLFETISGNALNFSAATGRINTLGQNGTASLIYLIANNIQLGTVGASCALTLGNNSGSASFYFNGSITELKVGGGSTLTKAGNNTVNLVGNNVYSGLTLVGDNTNYGTLRLCSPYALPGGIGAASGTSALTIRNSCVELAYDDFLRNLGTGASEFQMTGTTATFSTKGVRNVIVNNDPNTELVWGSATFNPTTFRLLDGSADSSITLQNKIDLNSASAARTISVNNGNNASHLAPAIISGVIRNSAGSGGITKAANGYLKLTGLNTFTGGWTLNDGGGGAGNLLLVNYMPDGGVASPLGMSSSDASNLKFGNTAGIMYIGSGDSSDRSFTFNNGTAGTKAVLDASGSGPLVLTSSSSPAFTTPNTSRILYLSGRNPMTNTLAAVLADNGSGALSVAKANNGITGLNTLLSNGKWVLSGASTFTGPVTINAGILSIPSIDVVANANPLGKSSTAAANLVLSGGILQYTGSGGSCDRSFTLSASSGLEASGTGALNLNNTSVAMAFGGTANSAYTLTLTGSSTESNTLSVPITMNGTGATALTKVGRGTWVLNGPVVNTYTGATKVDTGTLVEDFSNMTSGYANLINSSSALTLGGGTLSLLGKASNASTQTFGNPTFTGNQAGSGISVSGGSGSTMTLTLGNTWTRANGAGATLNVTLGIGGTLTSNPTQANGIVVGSGNVAFATVGGTDWATVSGGNIAAYSGYTSPLPPSGSTSTVNYSLTDNGTVTATETANTLKINTTTTSQSLAISSGQALTLNAGGLLFVGAADYSITGGTLKGQNGTGELVVHQFGSGNLTLSSALTSAAILTKTGSGTLTLDTAQVFTGNTLVGGGGTLVLKHQNALEKSPLYINNSSIVFDSSAGTAFTVGGLNSPASAPYGGVGYDIALQNSSGQPITLTVNGGGTYYGTLSGAGSLIKTNSGTLSLGGWNTFTGGVTVNGGRLNYGTPNNDWCLGGGGTYAGTTQLTFNNGTTLGLDSHIVNGTVTLNGATVTSGNSFGSVFFGSIVLQSGGCSFVGQNGNTIDIYSVISGTGGLTKINTSGNSGKLRLYNANTFTGNTVLSGNGNIGTTGAYLILQHALALQNSVLDTATSATGNTYNGLMVMVPALKLGGLSGNKDLASLFVTTATGGLEGKFPMGGYSGLADLTLNPGVGQTPSYSGAIVDGALGMTLTKTGAGTQTLSGVNTYTGATTIKAGTLALGASGTLDGDNDVILAGGTLDMGSFNNTVKTLAVTGNSTLALGSGNLTFANSSAVTWTGNLTLTGTLGATTLRFGGLTQPQLDRITINGKRVYLNGSGYIGVKPDGLIIHIY